MGGQARKCMYLALSSRRPEYVKRWPSSRLDARVQLREPHVPVRPVYIFGTFSLVCKSSSQAPWKNSSPFSFVEDGPYDRGKYITSRFVAHENDRGTRSPANPVDSTIGLNVPSVPLPLGKIFR